MQYHSRLVSTTPGGPASAAKRAAGWKQAAGWYLTPPHIPLVDPDESSHQRQVREGGSRSWGKKGLLACSQLAAPPPLEVGMPLPEKKALILLVKNTKKNESKKKIHTDNQPG